MDGLTRSDIEDFLTELGNRYPHEATLYLLGGSALCLLGNPRVTLDIDYDTQVNDDAQLESLSAAIVQLANELQLELEPVPLAEFIPLPAEANTRHRLVGHFGKITVNIYDPYSIALSKVARGLESDLEDVVFLIQQKLITLSQLEAFVLAALPRAWAFDIDPADLQTYLAELRRLMANL